MPETPALAHGESGHRADVCGLSVVWRIGPRVDDSLGRPRWVRGAFFATGTQGQSQQHKGQKTQQIAGHADLPSGESAFSHFCASFKTLADAVPPSLVREAIDASTVRTE